MEVQQGDEERQRFEQQGGCPASGRLALGSSGRCLPHPRPCLPILATDRICIHCPPPLQLRGGDSPFPRDLAEDVEIFFSAHGVPLSYIEEGEHSGHGNIEGQPGHQLEGLGSPAAGAALLHWVESAQAALMLLDVFLPPLSNNRRPVPRGDGGVRGAGDGGAAAARGDQLPHPGLPVAGGARGVAAPLHRRLHPVRGGEGAGPRSGQHDQRPGGGIADCCWIALPWYVRCCPLLCKAQLSWFPFPSFLACQTHLHSPHCRAFICCRQLARDGVRGLLAVPISFVSEHIETLEEIDCEYRCACRCCS